MSPVIRRAPPKVTFLTSGGVTLLLGASTRQYNNISYVKLALSDAIGWLSNTHGRQPDYAAAFTSRPTSPVMRRSLS